MLACCQAVLQYVCRRDMFLGGVHFVNLRSAQSAESVALKLAQALNMRGHSPNMDHLVRELNMRSLGHASTRGRTFAGASPPASRGRLGGSPHQVLIVLDNAEDLLHAADGALSNFVQPILDGCGSVQFLVTSKVGAGCCASSVCTGGWQGVVSWWRTSGNDWACAEGHIRESSRTWPPQP